ncbi:DNA-binding XRE family transcriptional regulator [Pseudomonas sp. TE3786]
MDVQVIMRDGEAEYAVLPWAEYQALLQAAGRAPAPVQSTGEPAGTAPAVSSFSELTALREAKGLTLEALARTVGISPHYLTMIESGERQPDSAIRRALAWNLGVSSWEADT